MSASDIFLNIATGKPFDGKLPDTLSIPVSEEHGDLIVTRIVSAKPGDPDYDKVLVAWMYIHGYVQIPAEEQPAA